MVEAAVLSALTALGREPVGPAFSHYIHQILARVDELSVDWIGFVAREGFLLQQLYETLKPKWGGPEVAHRYVHLSRLSTALPSVERIGLRELNFSLGRPDNQGVWSLLKTFDLTDPEMVALAKSLGVSDLSAHVSNWWGNFGRLEKLVDSPRFQAAVSERVMQSRALLRRYLEAEGFFAAKRALLVDVGWNGTIQNNLVRAFGKDPNFPELHGIYFGLVDDSWQSRFMSSAVRKEGVLADYRRSRRLPEQSIFHFVEIFEQAAQAPHGTTLRYVERDGKVVPLHKSEGADRAAELANTSAIAALQQGIRDAARTYEENLVPGRAPTVSARSEIQRRLDRFIFRPTRAERQAVAVLTHSDNWGLDSHHPLMAEMGPSALLRPRRWYANYHRQYWRPGYIAATAGPIASRLFHVYKQTRPLR